MATLEAIPQPTVWGQRKTVFLTTMTAAVGLFTFYGPAQGAFQLPEGLPILLSSGVGFPKKKLTNRSTRRSAENSTSETSGCEPISGYGLNTETTSVSAAAPSK